MSSGNQRALENIAAKKRRDLKKQSIKAEVTRIGDRVKVKFVDGVWYEGTITKIERGAAGELILLGILYDDGVEVDCEWPDKDIILVRNETDIIEPQLKRRKVMTGKQDDDEEGEWMFTCSFAGCNFTSKQASNVNRHKANIHDIAVTYYFCGVAGCGYKAKALSNVKAHKSFVHNISVIWYHCGAKGCFYKSKQVSSSKKHRNNCHKVGT